MSEASQASAAVTIQSSWRRHIATQGKRGREASGEQDTEINNDSKEGNSMTMADRLGSVMQEGAQREHHQEAVSGKSDVTSR